MASASIEQEYRHMVATKLEPLARQRRTEYEAILQQRKEVHELREHVAALSVSAEAGEAHKILADIGGGFMMKARIDEGRAVAIDVGLGLFVEMPAAEAGALLAQRLSAADR
jgi:prefoldin subunit 5